VPASTTQRIPHWLRVTPNASAFIEWDATYGFGDLAAGIAQWTRALTASSVGPGMLLGIQHERRYPHFQLMEDRIRALPGIRDVALIVSADSEELVVALEAEHPPPQAVMGAMTGLLAGMVTRFTPRVLAALPRTETGKIQRRALRDLIAPLGDARVPGV
jgi:hypothetical protein